MGGNKSDVIKRVSLLGGDVWGGGTVYLHHCEFPIDPGDPMHNPKYIYEVDTDVWVHRQGSDTTCMHAEAGTCGLDIHPLDTTIDRPEWVERETVLNGVDEAESTPVGKNVSNQPKINFPPDHYDSIKESDIDLDETELKVAVIDPLRYQLFPLPSVHPQSAHRHHYEDMVKIFQPLIVSNVITRHILPHLPFLSDPERIRAIDERDPRAAVAYLLDELCSNTNTEPGRWKQFIEALERCGYKYIVDTLRGQAPIDHTYQREYLKRIAPVLREIITPSELLPFLWAVDVISNEDREEIKRIESNRGCIAAADKLLDAVPRRHRHWYSHFVNALQNAGSSEAEEMLAIPEILNDGKQYSNTTAMDKSASKANASKSELAEDNGRRETGTEESCCNKYLDMNEDMTYSDEITAVAKDKKQQSLAISGLQAKRDKDQMTNEPSDNRPEEELYEPPDNRPEQEYEPPDNRPEQEYEPPDNRPEEEYEPPDPLPEEYGPLPEEYGPLHEEYEPPLPARHAPRKPKHEDSQSCLHSDGDTSDMDDFTESETDSIEVVPLRPSFKWTFRNDRVNKLPIPTPRKRIGKYENTKPLAVVDIPQPLIDNLDNTGSMQLGLADSEHEEEKTNLEYTKPLAVVDIKQPLIDNLDKTGSMQLGLADSEHEEEKTNLENTKPLAVVDIPQPLIDNLDKTGSMQLGLADAEYEEEKTDLENVEKMNGQQMCRKKVKSTFKSKCKVKKIYRAKLSNRRKPMNCISGNNEELQMKFNKGKPLIRRDRMLRANDDRNRSTKPECETTSKNLPPELGELRQKEDTDVQQATGNDINVLNDDTDTQPAYYSEPFRSHRSREDEDIFTTCEQVNTKNLAYSQNETTSCTRSKQRNMSQTDELIDILKCCNNVTTDGDYILKSNVELGTITKENLNPDLRNNLETVRDLKVKLNSLIHDDNVSQKKLVLQEDVNEMLKRKRDITDILSIKEKEAKALEAAIRGENIDPEEADQLVPNSCAELCTRTDFQEKEHSVPTNEMSSKFSFQAAQLPIKTDSRTRDSQKGVIQTDTTYNDSAFYSEFSTYL